MGSVPTPLMSPRSANTTRWALVSRNAIRLRGIVTGFVFGPLGVLSMMRGAENLFKDCLLHPQKVMQACETITGVLIEFVLAQCDAGIPAMGGIRRSRQPFATGSAVEYNRSRWRSAA